MKRVYWRPKNVSRTALLLISAFAIAGLIVVESFPVINKQRFRKEKVQAAQLAKDAFEVVKQTVDQRGIKINPRIDPAGTGLLGLPMSSVTSLPGSLPEKQTTVNPNFAAAIVEMLKDAGVSKGDHVAVGVSGSFPALNICTYAALETLEAKPIVIASCASSSYGANTPNMLWIDMEKAIVDEGVFATRAVAASIGGDADRGLNFTEEGVANIKASIERNGLRLLSSKKFTAILDKRMSVYREYSGGDEIKAYVNVGGGMASVGRTEGKEAFKSGLNEDVPEDVDEQDGIMHRFVRDRVPVIHLVKIKQLATKYGLPESPAAVPTIGDGGVYRQSDYNRWLVAAMLAGEIALLYLFIRSDIGFRLLRPGGGKRADQSAPEPMV